MDALRTYVVFIAPFDASVTWDESGIRGVTRFLSRFYALAHDVATGEIGREDAPGDEALRRLQHATVARVTDDMEAFKYNTAVAALMAWLNELEAARDREISPAQWREMAGVITILLAPFAPFLAEEVWQVLLGHGETVHRQPWPAYDPALLEGGIITLAVQVERLRDTIASRQAPPKKRCRRRWPMRPGPSGGRAISRVIVVPSQMVNVVTSTGRISVYDQTNRLFPTLVALLCPACRWAAGDRYVVAGLIWQAWLPPPAGRGRRLGLRRQRLRRWATGAALYGARPG